MNDHARPPTLLNRLGPAGILAVLALALPPLGSLALFATMGTTGPWLKSHAELGLVLYASAFAILAGLALLPTYAQSALGGFAFGIAWGVPAALVGFTAGAVIGYEIARRASGERVLRLVDEKPKWRAVRDALLGAADTPGGGLGRILGMIILLRLPPNSPFALTNLVMASVRVPRRCFVVGTAIGMAPRTALAVAVGAGAHELSKDELRAALPPWALYAGIALTIAVFLFIGIIANRAIERVTRAATPAPGTLTP